MGVTFDGMGRLTAPSRFTALLSPEDARSLGFARDDRGGVGGDEFLETVAPKLVIPAEGRDSGFSALLAMAASSHGVEDPVVPSPSASLTTFFLLPAPEL